MVCNSKENSIQYLVSKGAINDVRKVIDRDLFDKLNDSLTRYAETKYGLDTMGAQLFTAATEQTRYLKDTPAYRESTYSIKRAVPNEVLFERLDQLVTQYENRSDTDQPMFNRPVVKMKKGVSELFNSNPELANIGTAEQYSQYLDAIFPNSQVKDIVYHGSDSKLEKFSKVGAGTHFGTLKSAKERRNKVIIPVILNINNPVLFKDILADDVLKAADEFLKENGEYLEYGYRNEESGLLVYLHKQGKIDSDTLWDALYSDRNTMMQILQNALGSNGYRYINEVEDKGSTSYVVFEPEQIYILGSKQDIEGFKNFVSTQPTQAPASTKPVKGGGSDSSINADIAEYQKLMEASNGVQPKSFTVGTRTWNLNKFGNYDWSDPTTKQIYMRNIDMETGQPMPEPSLSDPVNPELIQKDLEYINSIRKALELDIKFAELGYDLNDLIKRLINAKTMKDYNDVQEIFNKLC
jgi:hypothetical protein